MKPTKHQQVILDYIKTNEQLPKELIWSGSRRRMTGKMKILQIIWDIGTASSDTVLLQMGDAMHSEVYRSTLTTIFPGCVTAHDDTTMTISTQCVRDTIEKKGVEVFMSIDKAIQKSVAEYDKRHYNKK